MSNTAPKALTEIIGLIAELETLHAAESTIAARKLELMERLPALRDELEAVQHQLAQSGAKQGEPEPVQPLPVARRPLSPMEILARVNRSQGLPEDTPPAIFPTFPLAMVDQLEAIREGRGVGGPLMAGHVRFLESLRGAQFVAGHNDRLAARTEAQRPMREERGRIAAQVEGKE